MNIYYKILGAHVHMRVFMRGGKLGDLCCRKDEFDELRRAMPGFSFIPEPQDVSN